MHLAGALPLHAAARQCLPTFDLFTSTAKILFFDEAGKYPSIISHFGGEKRIEIEAKSSPIGHQTVNDRSGGATILDGTPAQSKDFVVFLWQQLILPKADAGIKCCAASAFPSQSPRQEGE